MGNIGESIRDQVVNGFVAQLLGLINDFISQLLGGVLGGIFG